MTMFDDSADKSNGTPSRSTRQSTPGAELVQQLEGLEIATNRIKQLPTELQVFLQPACVLHAYTRPQVDGQDALSDAEIVERPERMRACMVGIAAAHARRHFSEKRGFDIVHSTARLDLGSRAVRFIHNSANLPSESESHTYPDQLLQWLQSVGDAHLRKQSEIPRHLPQGDLYLCLKSKEAIEGALGTICEAVNSFFQPDSAKAGARFVVVRPPGHHCGDNSPSGFCLVNNILVGAAHAYLEHPDIDRIVIFDIDLHHGNGTQQITWRINSEAEKAPKSAASSPRKTNSPLKQSPLKNVKERANKRPLRIFYGSLHDILSYPCEDGDPERIANASMRINGGHGQYITNIHLEQFNNEGQFHSEIYPKYAKALFGDATHFLKKTGGTPENTLILISAGMDASEHEYSSMSRHNRRVPTSFFSKFAADAKAFANSQATYSTDTSPRKGAATSSEPVNGRIIACLEGGYSDRALMTGTAAFLSGFQSLPDSTPPTWDLKDVQQLEKLSYPSPPSGRRPNRPDWAIEMSRTFFAISREDSTAWDRYWSVSSIKREPVQLPEPTRMHTRGQPRAEAAASSENVKVTATSNNSESPNTGSTSTSGSPFVAQTQQTIAVKVEETEVSLSELDDSFAGLKMDPAKPSTSKNIKLLWQGSILRP